MYKINYFDNHNNMKRILNNKYIILVPILILNIISLIYLYNTEYFYKHLLYLGLSYLSLFIISKINYRFILKYIKFFYIISIILLIIVLIFGREIKGSKAWLHIYNISIQPSEITKLVLTIYLAYLTIKKKNIILLLIITLIPSILTFLEPDTGAILFYIIIFLSILRYYKINKKILYFSLSIISIFIIANIFIYLTNKDLLINIYGTKLFYRLDRLIAFKNQNNIQNVNSLISIGSHNLIYIPENHNDFIFASIISKYKILSFIIIIGCYISIFLYYLKHSFNKKNISSIINFIILNMLLFQTFYNILMNLSLLPIIGIPLPFLSYGGTYLLTLYLLIGFSINLNIHSNNRKVQALVHKKEDVD